MTTDYLFGKYVREKRLERGLSQIELARIAGISNATISYIESGRNKDVTLDTLSRLSRALKIPFATLKSFAVRHEDAPSMAIQRAPHELVKEISRELYQAMPVAVPFYKTLGDKQPLRWWFLNRDVSPGGKDMKAFALIAPKSELTQEGDIVLCTKEIEALKGDPCVFKRGGVAVIDFFNGPTNDDYWVILDIVHPIKQIPL